MAYGELTYFANVAEQHPRQGTNLYWMEGSTAPPQGLGPGPSAGQASGSGGPGLQCLHPSQHYIPSGTVFSTDVMNRWVTAMDSANLPD
jgi:hypothetical protein